MVWRVEGSAGRVTDSRRKRVKPKGLKKEKRKKRKAEEPVN
jgi:hypothetical protein